MTMPDDELDARLRAALHVEPSPEFLPRVRARLQSESPAPRVGWLVPALAALAAVVALALWIARPATEPQAPRVAHAPASTLTPTTLAVSPVPSVPLAQVSAPVSRPRPVLPPSPAEPEVLVPAGQEEAALRFFAALQADERPIAAPPDLKLNVAEIHIEPLSIPPLS
jgi:hypothetical protein